MRTTTRTALALAVLAQLASAARASGQAAASPVPGSEAALRAAFEGKTVTVKMDLPATSQGVDVFPTEAMPVDFREVAERLKEHGTALRIGQQVMITKVAVKRSSHIEFQLGGGGYGTVGDWMSSPTVTTPISAGETKEERALRDRIKATGDKDERKRLERELAALRSARERENARAANEAQHARAAAEANLRAKRAESGSRFNVRYKHGMPAEALTPESVTRALAQYVDFPGAPAPSTAAVATAALAPAGAATAVPTATAAPAAGVSALRKGMTLAAVETALGPAVTAAETKEGAIAVMKRSYRHDGLRVAASFVGGVLVDFAITPQ
jgi:hypothetical protein